MLLIIVSMAVVVASLFGAGMDTFVIGVAVTCWYYTIKAVRHLAHRYYQKA